MSLFPIEAFDHYWAMWNERDVALVRMHLERAVTDDVVFCDPVAFHAGRDALEANVRQLRVARPTVEFALGSGVDSHHDRHRYRWRMLRKGRLLLNGFDVATTTADGLIERIDGFFGPLPELPDVDRR
jgi:hypothetical protein